MAGFMRIGDRVEIIDGPLAGHIGIATGFEHEDDTSAVIKNVTVRLKQEAMNNQVWTEKFTLQPAKNLRVLP